MILTEKDIKVVHSVDEVGMVFFWENRFFRAINANHISNIKELISSKLLAELIDKNLFPETTICSEIEMNNPAASCEVSNTNTLKQSQLI